MRVRNVIETGCIILLFALHFSSDDLFRKGIPSGPTRLVFTHDPSWYTTSALVASGLGFKQADANKIPGFQEFLRQDRPTARTIDVALSAGEVSEPSSDVLRHRYLLTLIGWLWGIFGISWNVVRYLMMAQFCVIAVLMYGIFRLGMGRLVSLACTVMSLATPLLLETLLNPRDFSKAPFIIGAILIMGHLIKYPVSPRKLLLAGAGLGLISGIGFGFRTDSSMSLLPGAVVLMLFATIKPKSNASSFPNFHLGTRLFQKLCFKRRSKAELLPQERSQMEIWERGNAGKMPALRQIAFRGGAVLLQFVVFAVAASPVLVSEFACGSLFYHYFLIGLHTQNDDDIGLERASYERMYKESDIFVFDTRDTFVARTKLEAPKGSGNPTNWQNRQVALEFIKTFPGDMLARVYSAVLSVAGRNPLVPVAQWYRIYIIVATLFLLACGRLSWAWGALVLVVYFCGIMSYQFQWRHTFHLAFLNWWMIGFLFERLLYGFKGQDGVPASRIIGTIVTSLFRGLLFAACAVALIAGPLYVARDYQDRAFKPILSKYENAQLEEVATQSFPSDDWVSFSPKNKLLSEAYQAQQVNKPETGQYWVLEVADPPKEFCVLVQFDVDLHGDYTKLLHAGPFTSGAGHTAKFFFPVYEEDRFEDDSMCRFAGVALPKDIAPHFKRLSIVKNIGDFPLLFTLSLPDNPADFVSHQRFHLNWKEPEILCDAAAYDMKRQDYIGRTSSVIGYKTSDPSRAVQSAKAALLLYPRDMALYVLLAQSLDAQGARNEALGACLAALQICVDFCPVYAEIDRLLVEEKDPVARINRWRQIAGQYPDVLYPALFLGKALEEAGKKEEALAAYNTARQLSPCSEQAKDAIGRLSIR